MSETNEFVPYEEIEFTGEYEFQYDEFRLDPQEFVGDSRGGSVSLGPITIEWKYIPPDKIEIKVKIVGVTIWTGTLQAGKQTRVKIKADIGIAKCDFELIADFTKKELTAKGSACVREIVKWPPSWKWSCSSFNKVIARW